jgi:hypothetical protein
VRPFKARRYVWTSCAIFGALLVDPARAAPVAGDPLELAIEAPRDLTKFADNTFDIFGADALVFDDNIYRVPSGTALQSLPGINADASRKDHINVATLGLDGEWNRGRQTFTADLQVDDNRYQRNGNLNDVSTSDKVAWLYQVGDILSGQIGAVYSQALIPFTNIVSYNRDLYATTGYFGAGRIQLGPRWAIYGGVLESSTTLSDVALQSNDTHAKSVDLGTEYATGIKDSVGVEYRYTDARYPRGTVLNDDYREDVGKLVFRHSFSDKTDIVAMGGFLRRDYASDAIPRFSGEMWRVDMNWQTTEKMAIAFGTWQNLQAYLTAQSDYYVSKGGRIAPKWTATEKIAVAVSLIYEAQDYVGVTASELSLGTRRDKLSTAQVALTYTPFKFLIFDFGYAYEKRESNEAQFQFNDNVASAKVTVKY